MCIARPREQHALAAEQLLRHHLLPLGEDWQPAAARAARARASAVRDRRDDARKYGPARGAGADAVATPPLRSGGVALGVAAPAAVAKPRGPISIKRASELS